MYLDHIDGLSHRYASCKQTCLDQNPQLKKDIENRQNASKKEYFDPMGTDVCLKECRQVFYYVTKKMNSYFVEDKGFYIEGAQSAEESVS